MITQNSISTISDLRFKTKEVLEKASYQPVILFNRSTPKGVILSWDNYQEFLSLLEDYFDSLKAKEYENEDKSKIKWFSHKEVKKIIQGKK
jgi:prevent-host-death family protein